MKTKTIDFISLNTSYIITHAICRIKVLPLLKLCYSFPSASLATVRHCVEFKLHPDALACVIQRTRTRLGDRSFSVAGPHLCNSLPAEPRHPTISLG